MTCGESGVRNLIRAGVPEVVAMRISGHKTRTIFDRYNIVNERDLKEAARKLERYISEKEEILKRGYSPVTVNTQKDGPENNLDSKLLNWIGWEAGSFTDRLRQVQR